MERVALGYCGISFFKKYFFIDFREGETLMGENHRSMGESWIGCLLRAPFWGGTHNPGLSPAWELNRDLWVHRSTAQPLSHASGLKASIFKGVTSRYS